MPDEIGISRQMVAQARSRGIQRLQCGSEFAPILFDDADPACVEHPAVSLFTSHQRAVCGDAVGDVGVRFKDPDGLAKTVVLQSPSGIDGKRRAVFRSLLHAAFPSTGAHQVRFDDLAPVGISGLQKSVLW